MTVGIPLNFNQPKLRQHLRKMLAVSLFLGLPVLINVGFPAVQGTLPNANQTQRLQPTREQILLRFSNLRSAVTKDGLLLATFGGHVIKRNGRTYLLPSTARIRGAIELS